MKANLYELIKLSPRDLLDGRHFSGAIIVPLAERMTVYSIERRCLNMSHMLVLGLVHKLGYIFYNT